VFQITARGRPRMPTGCGVQARWAPIQQGAVLPKVKKTRTPSVEPNVSPVIAIGEA
jgi:hypothetical protein